MLPSGAALCPYPLLLPSAAALWCRCPLVLPSALALWCCPLVLAPNAALCPKTKHLLYSRNPGCIQYVFM